MDRLSDEDIERAEGLLRLKPVERGEGQAVLDRLWEDHFRQYLGKGSMNVAISMSAQEFGIFRKLRDERGAFEKSWPVAESPRPADTRKPFALLRRGKKPANEIARTAPEGDIASNSSAIVAEEMLLSGTPLKIRASRNDGELEAGDDQLAPPENEPAATAHSPRTAVGGVIGSLLGTGHEPTDKQIGGFLDNSASAYGDLWKRRLRRAAQVAAVTVSAAGIFGFAGSLMSTARMSKQTIRKAEEKQRQTGDFADQIATDTDAPLPGSPPTTNGGLNAPRRR